MSRRVIASLEELQEWVGGPALGVSEWAEIGQDAINRFAELTGDRQWIHLDTERAAGEGPWGSTVAHGFLTLSHLSRMAHEAMQFELGQTALINYGLNKVRFPAPVPAGAKIRGHFRLIGCAPKTGAVDTIWEVTVEARGSSKPVCVAEWVLRLVNQPASI